MEPSLSSAQVLSLYSTFALSICQNGSALAGELVTLEGDKSLVFSYTH